MGRREDKKKHVSLKRFAKPVSSEISYKEN